MNELTRAASFFFDGNFSNEVRIIEKNNVRWFIASDVCKILEIGKPANILRYFPDEEKGVYSLHTLGGNQKMRIVNEAGLYRLVFKSRKPVAKEFQTWVFNEVLPSIRKYGTYRAALPKNWSFKDEHNLTWSEWSKRYEKEYFKRHPRATFEDFLNYLPTR